MGIFGKKKEKESDFPAKYGGFNVAGLDFPEGVACYATVYPDTVTIGDQSKEYTLQIANINSIECSFDVRKETEYKTSLIGSAAGAAVAGIPGAMVGGIKKKGKNFVQGVTILNYSKSDGNDIYIKLIDAIENTIQAAGLYDKLKPLVTPKPTKTITL